MRKFFIFAVVLSTGISGLGYAAKSRGAAAQKSVSVPSEPKIRVLLEKEVATAILEAKGPYRVIRKDTNAILSSGNTGKRFIAHALQDGLRWGEEYPDVYQIQIVPTSPDTTLFVNGIQYKGAVSLYHVRNNKIAIVNEVSIEDYLKSTMTLQCPENLSKEATYALAILARTEAYAKYLNGKTAGRPWDITAKEAKYYGYAVSYQPLKVEESVDWTRYMVLDMGKEDGGSSKAFKLPHSKIQELADRGYDAKRILTAAFPHMNMGITIDPQEIALR